MEITNEVELLGVKHAYKLIAKPKPGFVPLFNLAFKFWGLLLKLGVKWGFGKINDLEWLFFLWAFNPP